MRVAPSLRSSCNASRSRCSDTPKRLATVVRVSALQNRARGFECAPVEPPSSHAAAGEHCKGRMDAGGDRLLASRGRDEAADDESPQRFGNRRSGSKDASIRSVFHALVLLCDPAQAHQSLSSPSAAMAPIKLYIDFMSQPSRAVLMLLLESNVPFEVKEVKIARGETRSKEFKGHTHRERLGGCDTDGSSSVLLLLD